MKDRMTFLAEKQKREQAKGKPEKWQVKRGSLVYCEYTDPQLCWYFINLHQLKNVTPTPIYKR